MFRGYLRAASFLGLVTIASVIVGACGSGSQSSSGNAAATLGVATPLTGPDGQIGQPIANGVQLAVNLANQKGGLPAKLNFEPQDDQEKPEVGVTVARKFCSESAVIGVVGDLASTVTGSTQTIYNGCDLVQVTPTSSLDSLSSKGYKNFFRTTALNKDYGGQTVKYVASIPNVKTVVSIDDNESTTIGLSNTFSTGAQALGLKVLPAVHVTANGADFRGALTSVVAAKPDLINLALFINDAALVVKQADELGYTGLFMGIDGDISPDFAKLAGAAADGRVYFTTVGLDPLSMPSAKQFAAAYKQTFGVDANTFAANAFDAANAIINAWKAAGTNDRKTIVSKMPSVSFQGSTSHIAFTSTGDLVTPTVGVFQLKGGQITFVGPAVPLA